MKNISIACTVAQPEKIAKHR